MLRTSKIVLHVELVKSTTIVQRTTTTTTTTTSFHNFIGFLPQLSSPVELGNY